MTEGELWARELLAELRDAGFRPRAWTRFLTASFDRSARDRRAHRHAHRQVLAFAGAGLAAWAAVAILGRPGLALAGALWLALLALMVDWHLGMLEGPGGSTLPSLGRANLVTMARGAAVPAFFALDESGLLAALVSSVALDLLDGALARRRDERTRLGAWLDGSLDSIAGAAIGIAAVRLDAVPVLLGALIVLRVAVPWILLTRSYFLSPRPLGIATDLREPSVAARLPGSLAAAGVALALAGIGPGATIAVIGVTASIAQFLLLANAAERRLRSAQPPLPGREPLLDGAATENQHRRPRLSAPPRE